MTVIGASPRSPGGVYHKLLRRGDYCVEENAPTDGGLVEVEVEVGVGVGGGGGLKKKKAKSMPPSVSGSRILRLETCHPADT